MMKQLVGTTLNGISTENTIHCSLNYKDDTSSDNRLVTVIKVYYRIGILKQ